MSDGTEGLGDRPRNWLRRRSKGLEVRERDCTVSLRADTSSRSLSNSSASWGAGARTAATEGDVATSMMLSASWARSCSLVDSPVEAKTMRTFDGKRCRNSSRRKVWSGFLSPNSCSMRRSSWVGFRSPNSSKLRSCCRRCCSVAAVRLINCCLSWSYGVLAGGERMRSRTSVATSGANDETTWSNFVLCCVMCLVVNCASICANHSCGSVGQNGGILRLVIATVGIALVAGSAVGGSTAGGSVSVSDILVSHDGVTNVGSCYARSGYIA